MYYFNRYLASAAIFAFTSLSAPAGAALVQYIYTGNPFTEISSGFGASRVYIQFTVDDSLVPRNGRANFADNGNIFSNLNDFYFSDGTGFDTLASERYSPIIGPAVIDIWFDTDADGNVSGSWDARASSAHGNELGLAWGVSISSSSILDSTSSFFSGGVERTAVVANNPGTWIRNTPPIPEPVSWILFSIGLGVILLAKARQVRTVRLNTSF